MSKFSKNSQRNRGSKRARKVCASDSEQVSGDEDDDQSRVRMRFSKAPWYSQQPGHHNDEEICRDNNFVQEDLKDAEAALSAELDSFASYVALNSDELAVRKELVRLITSETRALWGDDVRVTPFGSSASGLGTYASDLDVVCHGRSVPEAGSACTSLARSLGRAAWAEAVQAIQARVPIVTLRHRDTTTQMDISFVTAGHASAADGLRFLSHCASIPVFRPVAVTLKVILAHHKLDKPFTGGLGSYKLYVMLATLLDGVKSDGLALRTGTPGAFLRTFLRKYGHLQQWGRPCTITADRGREQAVFTPNFDHSTFVEVLQSAATSLRRALQTWTPASSQSKGGNAPPTWPLLSHILPCRLETSRRKHAATSAAAAATRLSTSARPGGCNTPAAGARDEAQLQGWAYEACAAAVTGEGLQSSDPQAWRRQTLGSTAAKEEGNRSFAAMDFAQAHGWYTVALDRLRASSSSREYDMVPVEAGVLYSNRSAAALAMGAVGAALADASACVTLRPDWLKAFTRLGAALLAAKKYSEAVEAYTRALKIEPGNSLAMAALGGARAGAAAQALGTGEEFVAKDAAVPGLPPASECKVSWAPQVSDV
ncbi:hypothetical protein CYMTET_34171 [Cymbomonas tetramitiformis]|uniref:Poly(A) RNA polymerase mitochondrial-like central palm domain-containing protein n=1 Tax=Cymbomonas tetramitiformis TaxID=36881 RepID=A0AAE0FBQ5_9CHLO|nr:hypothetical protein CYMTET_34171 [Cymbomonas tetramitiformis]